MNLKEVDINIEEWEMVEIPFIQKKNWLIGWIMVYL